MSKVDHLKRSLPHLNDFIESLLDASKANLKLKELINTGIKLLEKEKDEVKIKTQSEMNLAYAYCDSLSVLSVTTLESSLDFRDALKKYEGNNQEFLGEVMEIHLSLIQDLLFIIDSLKEKSRHEYKKVVKFAEEEL